ncbi:MAG: hypothetical protein IBJ16_04275 [Chitinophagaceae bacterium]|nr:hypothetical protein [Chitinophagaceae bacterium]
MRKYFADPGIWILVLMNAFVMYYYMNHPDSIHTIIALFWLQSVIIGIFNTLDIFTLSNTVPGSFEINNESGNRQGCAGFFFLLHYGFFHMMYLLFLVPSVIDLQKLDWSFLRITFWLLIACSTIEFIRDKVRNKSEAVNIGMMFFMPYARIIPMHVIVILPAFWPKAPGFLFLALKVVADVIMYIIYKNKVFVAANQLSRSNK